MNPIRGGAVSKRATRGVGGGAPGGQGVPGGAKEATIIRWALGTLRLRVERRTVLVGTLLLALLLVLGAVSLASGKISLGPSELWAALWGSGEAQAVKIVGTIRLPRLITALCVGMALGASGCIFQSISRNTLGSPDVIGFTTGAATGAVIQIVVFDAGAAATSLAAVVAGLVTAAVVYALARTNGAAAGYRLVLVGIGVSAFVGAINTLMLVRGDLDLATKARIWLSGSLNARTWEDAIPVAVAVVLLVPILAACSRWLDVLEMGDDLATQLGVHPEHIRQIAMFASVVLTAAAVAAAGPIAFIALSAPQIARRLTQAPRVQVVTSALVGAALLLAADLISIHLPVKIAMPVGLTTGLLGGIYLLWLLTRTRAV
ncbi:MAG: iron chelate uptake ABC transporter family permease subunit [Ancrocorticia sp.]